MEIIYRAHDGTEFSNEDACLEYERRQETEALNLQSRFFDFDGVPMDIKDLYHCLENGWYMEIATIEEARIIAEYAKREVGITISGTGLAIGRYYWNDSDEKWHNIEDLYQAYARVLNVFEPTDLGE